jgi:hypothetical protein
MNNEWITSITSKTWVFYAVALLCFLLPFGNISCSGVPDKTIAKASGVQIVLDQITVIDSEQSKPESDKSNFPIGIRVLVAITMLALVAGIVCSLLRSTAYAVAFGTGIGTVICLVVGLLVMRQAATENGFIISPAYGWWLSFLLSLAGSAMALLRLIKQRLE